MPPFFFKPPESQPDVDQAPVASGYAFVDGKLRVPTSRLLGTRQLVEMLGASTWAIGEVLRRRPDLVALKVSDGPNAKRFVERDRLGDVVEALTSNGRR